MSTETVVERDDVASLFDGRFPADGVAVVGRAGVSVGIAHLGNEPVTHRSHDIVVAVGILLKFLSEAVHVLIVDGEG